VTILSKPRPLDKMLLRLLLLRLFLPSLVVTLLAVGLTAYVRGRNLGTQQLLLARSLAHTVDDYLEHASRVLGAVAQVAETSAPEELASYMQATWQAYGYFDTLYRLDESGIVTLLAPPDPRYQGFNMSHQPYFRQARAQTGVTISPPFTSLRTEQPAVYMVWPLAACPEPCRRDGDLVVGELNLGALHEAIAAGGGEQYFIADRSGTLLAHPQSDLVAQQANVGRMEIVQRGLTSEATLLYATDGAFVLGSATQVERTGWIVVAQTPLSVAYGPYVWSIGLALLLAPAVWLAMILHFRQQLRHHVVAPLARLSQGAGALADGDFAQGAALAAAPAAFAEVGALAADFERMSQAIQARQEALRQYAFELEARNEELDAFAHTVAHDLKGPSSHMVNFAEALEEDHTALPEEEMHSYLQTIAQNGRKMCNIIDELLLLAVLRKIQEIELGPLDMASIVAEAHQRLAYVIEECQAEIILPETWPVALGYGPWVEEVWVNYLSNAIKYGGQPPRVELGASLPSVPAASEGEAKGERMVRFWVHDNGFGLTPEEQARLFTSFTRLDQVRAKGHGLGLSIVRRIVGELGGDVGVESEVGAGSTFWFALPA
jgi:signal transduction histidine kinase